jgi:membrane protein DedA with SNARE-associated domain
LWYYVIRSIAEQRVKANNEDVMTLESLIETHGYWAVLLGTFFEGETFLLLGSFAASRGYLVLRWVIVVAFFGSLCADQVFFFLGRRYSPAILARRPSWKARSDKAQRLLERFRTPLILAFRFMYGMRTAIPFAIGMSKVPTGEFVFLNMIGASVWAIIVGTGGYLFGNALETLLGNIKHYEFHILGGIAIAGALTWALYFLYRYRRHKTSSTSTASEPGSRLQ